MKLKYSNYFLVIIMLCGDVVYFSRAMVEENNNMILTCLALPLVLLIPFILRKLKVLNLNPNALFVYNLFMFFADFLGCVVGLYNKTTYYDVVMHFVSGFSTALLGMVLYNYLAKKEEDNKILKYTYIVGFCMAIAAFWEIFEFFGDNTLGMNLQHSIDTGVRDTMEDIICAVMGMFTYLGVFTLSRSTSSFHKFIEKISVN
ncbi:MAG: DUF2238 domain-containing protein [Clostridium sp.]|nr:DUF2238 domain-containing protein [Clostridium sp.]